MDPKREEIVRAFMRTTAIGALMAQEIALRLHGKLGVANGEALTDDDIRKANEAVGMLDALCNRLGVENAQAVSRRYDEQMKAKG
ncbi:MAG: hypothetical protein ACM33T_05165 [Solirubrobacterales bacterium]